MAGLGQKLSSLVQAEPDLVPYVLAHLGVDAPPSPQGENGGFAKRVFDLRQQICQEWIARGFFHSQQREQAEEAQLQQRENQLLEVGERVIATQLFQQSSFQVFLRKLPTENRETLRGQLKDRNPLVRFLAITTIRNQHRHLELALIESLKDPHPEVRKAAHQALVRVARGTDFGPFPGASQRGIERSLEKWRQWQALQESESPETLAREAALLAVGRQAKPTPVAAVSNVLTHEDQTTLTPAATKACEELVKAKGAEQTSLLARLRDAKDSDSLEALVLAIPQLHGDVQHEAREALLVRLTHLPSSALRDRLQDDRMEMRCAAALACGRQLAKDRVADLVQLLDDPERDVVQTARAVLTELTGEDFGPRRDADRRAHDKAIAAWRDWYKQQSDRHP